MIRPGGLSFIFRDDDRRASLETRLGFLKLTCLLLRNLYRQTSRTFFSFRKRKNV